MMTVRADAFCHSMVRSLVGALLAVGEGRRDGRTGRRQLLTAPSGPPASRSRRRTGCAWRRSATRRTTELAARQQVTRALRAVLSDPAA